MSSGDETIKYKVFSSSNFQTTTFKDSQCLFNVDWPIASCTGQI